MRPFAFALARRLRIGGLVMNRTDGVWLEVEGASGDVARFVDALRREAPVLARIDGIDVTVQQPLGEGAFRIAASVDGTPAPSFVAPDAATCPDCVRELFDPMDRRYRHAFVNCTSCGPRLTIVKAVPYDRQHTTMAAFAMCAACCAEYADAADRRFHAQPVACPACGPTLSLAPASRADPIDETIALLGRGAIVGIKGLGGYHLACDARSTSVVSELRRRKHRDDRPFAIMVADVDAAERLCHVDDAERALLMDVARPVVLLGRRAGAEIATIVAPGVDRLGVMLAYTPLHHLIARGTGFPLVMTSGNLADEPIAHCDDDARSRLGPISDAILRHDRVIHVRCDDSIAHVVDGAPAILRRSRGHAPGSIALPSTLARPTLALGAQHKAVFALGAGVNAFLSHHLGDLEHFRAWQGYRESIAHYSELLRIQPQRVVCDLHPEYASTILAEELARAGLERCVVQHHEAHAAAVFAEHGLTRGIAVVFDGAGFGRDGAIWGGEVFTGMPGRLRRAAHLRYVRLPGGDRAAREPWRMAVAHGLDADVEAFASTLASESEIRAIATMPAPSTSSAGRLFDAVAALLGGRRRISFEAQAAIELQALAERAGPAAPYAVELTDGDIIEIDTRSLIRDVAADVAYGVAASVVARRFHETLAAQITGVCDVIREREELVDVALSGGVFANVLLATRTSERLRERGFRVVIARRVPTNDGGISYGQLAHVAALDGEV